MSYHHTGIFSRGIFGAAEIIEKPCGDNAFLDDSGTCQCLPGYIVPKPDAGCQPAVVGGAVTLPPVTIVGTPGGAPQLQPPMPPPPLPPTGITKLNAASPWILGAAVGLLALVGIAALASGKKRATSDDEPYRATPNPGYSDIRPGDWVTFVDHRGNTRKGRAVMRGPHGWVLNMGGRYGTPAVVDGTMVTHVRKGRRR